MPSSLKKEIIAGFTTFFTMAYIVVVNPAILSQAGMSYESVFVATCLAAALGCFLMGFFANYPIALAPSMSLNAYFTFYVVQQLHYPWQAALGIVFLAGLLFAVLTFTQFRQWIIYTMPKSLQMAIAAGIGLFLIAIAFKNLGIHLTPDFVVPLNTKIWLCIAGVLLAILFDRFRVIGAILLSMLVVSALGLLLNLVHLNHVIAMPPSMSPTFLQLQMPTFSNLQSIIIILVFLFVTLFDNTGTLVAILHQAKLLPQNQHDVRAKNLGRALFADSLAATLGALLGTSSTGSYIESAAGVRSGGRTGMTAYIVGLLFICALFFAPLAKAIPDYAAAAALIYVGGLMTKSIAAIPLRNYTESVPALLCVAIIPLTFSIADGVSAGFISYVLLKTITGKTRDLNFSLWMIALLCSVYLATRLL